jgi:hypothetical protein
MLLACTGAVHAQTVSPSNPVLLNLQHLELQAGKAVNMADVLAAQCDKLADPAACRKSAKAARNRGRQQVLYVGDEQQSRLRMQMATDCGPKGTQTKCMASTEAYQAYKPKPQPQPQTK